MEDEKIIGLYWDRNEEAVAQTAIKYGKLFYRIANNILWTPEDSEECVNDTYLGVWNAIPQERPTHLGAFSGRITRNLALKKFDYLSAAKRNPEAACSLEELGECVSGKEYVENAVENRRIEQTITSFLWQLEEQKRAVFIYRYWYFDSVETISRRTGYSRSKIKSMLFHIRQKLRKHLESEGIEL